MSYIGAKPASGRSGIWLPEAVRRRRAAGLWFAGISSSSGGSVTESGGFRIHTFTSSGTFSVVGDGVVEVELLGGGGGGGSGSSAWADGGGGGGGGYLLATIPVSGSNAVTVGALGAGNTSCSLENNSVRGGTGGTSQFLTLQAFGGQGGAAVPLFGAGGSFNSTGALQVLASRAGGDGVTGSGENLNGGGSNGKRVLNPSWTAWGAGAAGTANSVPGTHADGYGNGGAGGNSCQTPHRGGGNGSPGIVIIRYAIT